ncbi:MAG TPA: ABC transporter substrate-binding protein [Pseudonocardiaceae bacterium]
MAVSALLLVLTSCTASVFGAERNNTGYLVVALAGQTGILDPTQSSTFDSRIVFANLCEKLYDVNAALRIVPELAAGLPKISADGLTYDITVRAGIKFNDGTTLDANAVRTSLLRDKTDPLSARKSELSPVTSVQVLDPTTVRLHLKTPFSPLTSILADRSGMVMSPTALAKEGDNFGRDPVCVGPFSFQAEPSPDEIDLVRSPFYYDSRSVALPGITFRVIVQPAVRATDLRSGDIDVMEQAAPQDRTTLGTDPGLATRTVPSLGYSGIYVNVGNVKGSTKASGLPDNVLAKYPTLRTALDLSLDRDAINKVVFDGDYTPSCTPLPTIGQWAVNLPCPSRDVAKARELVSRTGLPTPITIDLQVPNDSLDEELGTVIQSMAKDAGFAVRVDATEFTTLLANGASGKFQAQISGWSGRLDPDQDISQFYLPLSALNYSGNNDPRINMLINQGRTTVDTAARKQIYRQIAQATLAQRGIIYLFETGLTLASKKGVTGIGYYGDALIRLGHASLGGRA